MGVSRAAVARLEAGDCLEIIPRLVAEGIVVDACVTDPPYHLTSGNMSVDWSGFGPNGPKSPNKRATNKSGRGHKTGFMNQHWDGGDIAFRPETWATIATIMRPGAFLLAFGGTRTFHRLVCAIEDAGFVIQDTIAWMFGNGFPKRRDMLKPAFEPICVAYKPGGKRTLGVDECKVGTDGGTARSHQAASPERPDGGEDRSECWARTGHKIIELKSGRWPANVCHDGSDEVMEAFAAFGEKPGCLGPASMSRNPGNAVVFKSPRNHGQLHGDTGTAARFFYSAKADKQDRWGSKHPCLVPGEAVLTDGGLRAIETVGVGSRVLAHDGAFREVIDQFASPCDAPIYRIGVDGTNLTLRFRRGRAPNISDELVNLVRLCFRQRRTAHQHDAAPDEQFPLSVCHRAFPQVATPARRSFCRHAASLPFSEARYFASERAFIARPFVVLR